MGRLPYQSRIGKKRDFIFPTFSLVRTSQKNTLNEFETAIKMAPHPSIFLIIPFDFANEIHGCKRRNL